MQPDGPREIDTKVASAARLYDLYLGGTHNYESDQIFAAKALHICPFLPAIARLNRGFLRRAVQFMVDSGIKQFLDIGSGVPTMDNVHQVAHAIDPNIRVVYVDNSNEAIVTSRQMLEDEGNANAIALFGDLRRPETIVDAPEIRKFLDFNQPIGLLTVAVLHFVNPEDQPRELVRQYLDALPAGSYFAASHISVTEMTDTARRQLEKLEEAYGDTSNPATLRTKEEFVEFFSGLDVVKPGVTFAADWPEPDPDHTDDPARPSMYAAVGRKP